MTVDKAPAEAVPPSVTLYHVRVRELPLRTAWVMAASMPSTVRESPSSVALVPEEMYLPKDPMQPGAETDICSPQRNSRVTVPNGVSAGDSHRVLKNLSPGASYMHEDKRKAVVTQMITAALQGDVLFILLPVIKSVCRQQFNDYALFLFCNDLPAISIPVTRLKPIRAKSTAHPAW